MNRVAFIAAIAALILAPAASAAQADKPAADKAAPAAKTEKAAPAPKAEPAPPASKGEATPQKEAAKPAPEKEAAKPASAPVSAAVPPPAAEKVAMADKPKRPSRANEDARKCLELATNPEIAKCAEAFR